MTKVEPVEGSVIKTKLHKFGQSTSVKGVSRALQSKSKCLRLMWILAILFGAGFGLYQMGTLFKRYFSYGTTVKIEEVPTFPIFPDLTICNLNPIISGSKGYISYPTYIKTMDVLSETLSGFIAKANATKQLEEDVFSRLTSLSGYFQTIPKAMITNFTSSLILSCKVYNWKWTIEDQFDCIGQSLQAYWDAHYNLCTRVSLSEISARHNASIRGISLIIYIQDVSEYISLDYQHDMLNSKALGIRLLIHQPNTLPDIKKGINISPGFETKVTLEVKEKRSVGAPYTECQHLPSFDKESQEESERARGYDQSLCTELCLHDTLIDKCACLSSDLIFEQDYLDTYDFCANSSISSIAHDALVDIIYELCREEVLEIFRSNEWNQGSGVWNISSRIGWYSEASGMEVFPIFEENSGNLLNEVLKDFFREHSIIDFFSIGNRSVHDFVISEGVYHVGFVSNVLLNNLQCLQNYTDQMLVSRITSYNYTIKKLEKTVNQLMCLSKSGNTGTSCNCPQPCESTEYLKSISQSPWPHWSHILGFYCQIIRPHSKDNPTLKEQFRSFEPLLHYCNNRSVDYDDIFDKMSGYESDLIQDNFLQLDINFESMRITVYSTQAAITWETLFSNMGGTLNLWIGITFMTLFELFELLFDLIVGYCSKQEQKEC